VDIHFEGPIFSYEAKYVAGNAQHVVPAPMHKQAYAQALQMAEMAHKALQCKGVTRSDFRYDDTQGEPGTLYYLETNTQPGFTPLSLVPDIAKGVLGWSFDEVVAWVLEDASCPK
jgi:D-alanine-D-alanine ligase